MRVKVLVSRKKARYVQSLAVVACQLISTASTGKWDPKTMVWEGRNGLETRFERLIMSHSQ